MAVHLPANASALWGFPDRNGSFPDGAYVYGEEAELARRRLRYCGVPRLLVWQGSVSPFGPVYKASSAVDSGRLSCGAWRRWRLMGRR